MRKFLVLLCLLSFSTYAEDMRQFLGGTVEEKTDLEEDLDKTHEAVSDSFIPQTVSKAPEKEEVKNDSTFIVGSDVPQKDFHQPLTEKEQVHSVGTEVLGTNAKQENYLEFKNSELIKDLKHKGDKNFSFSFFKDSFDYKNSSSSFDKTYRGDSSNQVEASDNGKKILEIPVMLRFSGHELFFRREYIRLGAGAGLGLGYNGGKGYFADGTRSDVNFNLWTIPVDFSVLMEVPLAFLKFSVFGGPSVLGIIQDRSDLPEGSEKKNLRQASVGYFAGAKVGFSISELFPGTSYDYFGSYQVTRYYLTLEARMHEYSNFKTPTLSVSGTSYGVGFTFEYF